MATLSKTELIRRIIIGEVLIEPDAKDPEAKKLILNCLLKDSAPEDVEKGFKTYFEKVSSNADKTNKRKIAIKNCIEKHFIDIKIKDIMNYINTEVGSYFTKDIERIQPIVPPIFIDCINSNTLQPANLDLSLGNEVYVTTEKVPTKLNSMGKDGVVSIEPGEFGILMTQEYIFVPWDLMGYISVRLTHKQKGLVNISGFHADPGYYGKLMFAIFNAGPNNVPLRYNESVFMIMFNELTKLSEEGIAFSKRRWQGMENIPVETLSGLTGTSVSVRSLDERIKRLEMIFPVVTGGVASIVIAVIVWIVTHWK